MHICSYPGSDTTCFARSSCQSHHVAVEEEERDQTFSDKEEEAAKQAFSGGQRPMISIMGDGLAPGDVVAAVIRKVLIKLYKGKFIRYSELKVRERREERNEYFDLFKSLVQWEPCDEAKMKDLFDKACGKRIRDIFGKIRKKSTKPSWMGEKVYAYLLDGWKTEDFKKLSQQNKTNRASTRGEEVRPTTKSRRALHGHSQKKNGQWVD